MPFLSRVWINPLRQGAQKLLGNPQAMHAAVLGGIPTEPVNERVLWRVDADQPRRPALLVLSQSKPSWEHLVEQASWPSADTPQADVRDYAPLLDQLQVGRSFAFRLTANPTKATKHPDRLTPTQRKEGEHNRERSVVVGHRTVAHQLQWLLDRTASLGIRIPPARTDQPVVNDSQAPARSAVEPAGEQSQAAPPEVRVSQRQRLSFRRGGGQVTLQQVTYEGRLVVEDADRLRDVLLFGIGRGKAYGCGLLTLAPVSGPG